VLSLRQWSEVWDELYPAQGASPQLFRALDDARVLGLYMGEKMNESEIVKGLRRIDERLIGTLGKEAANALEKAAEDADEYKRLYHELIMQVGRKFPGETRHQTALRYIKERENFQSADSSQVAIDKEPILESIRIRMMREAYDLADEGNVEGYNAIKVTCSDVLCIIREWLVSLDFDIEKAENRNDPT
jgi:hypothetical protein